MLKKLVIFFLIIGCQEFNIPKQKGYLAHKFDVPNYKFFSNDCYGFNINSNSETNLYSPCNASISYKLLKADLFISNIKINDNIELIKSDFDKKISDNSRNIFEINASEFNNQRNKVFGIYYSFIGNAPSNIQFYITDSISNFTTGSLYFKTKPNYDSLLPSISYVKNDIKKIFETFQWK